MSRVWKDVTKEEARLRSKAVLDNIPFVPNPKPQSDPFFALDAQEPVPAVPPAAPKIACAACKDFGVELKRDVHEVIEAICQRPTEMISERCDRLQITLEQDSLHRKTAINVGLIESAGSVGNRRLLHQATDKGKKWAHLHGITVPTWHGSLIHAFITDLTESKIRLVAPEAKFEHGDTTQPGGVRPDGLVRLPGVKGCRLIIQAVVQHRAQEEAANLLKLCGPSPHPDAGRHSVGWVDLVLCVCINKKIQKSVEKAVKKLNHKQMPDKLVMFDVESLLDPAYDMTWIMDRDI